MTLSPLNQQSTSTAVEFDPFAAGEVLLAAPATESQKEIWASVQMGEDANCAYNESVSLRLRGELDIPLLRSALHQLGLRHEALRTTFSPDGATLCIAPTPDFSLAFTDLSGLKPQEQDVQIANFRKQAVTEPFNLEYGPLFRGQIIKLHAAEHLILLTVHHIICDGWSWAVLIVDLGKLYSLLKQDVTPELDQAERFSDYAIALETAEDSEETAETVNYWLQQFSGSVPVLDVPTDRPRPPVRTFDSDRVDWELSTELIASLKQLGVQLGCSFMATLLSSFEVFLHRLTGQEDLIVGISAAGQAGAGSYNLVGHCVNLLPLRTSVRSEQPFSDYLRSRKPSILDAYDHQQFTFGSLVQRLVLARDPSRIPLVPIVFNIDQGLEADQLQFHGLEAEFFSNPRAYENFEIFINATELKGSVTLECQYNTNLFDADTIRRRLAEFETLLTGIVADPNQRIAYLPILPADEQQRLALWNQIQAPNTVNACIHHQFELQVQQYPDNIAVVYENQQLTYRELNQRANQLAHYLQAKGIGPDQLVGLCLERSLQMIVAILGILKAGGAYVPLDPSQPVDRLTYMLEDAQISVLVSQQELLQTLSLPEQTRLNSICLDSDAGAIAQCSQDNVSSGVTADHLAYMIYTSGSTGKPKGVLINHSNVVRLFESTQDWYHFNAQDVWTVFHSSAFDFSVWEIWGALLYGGRLIVVPYLISRSPQEFYTLLHQERVTVLNQTPSAFRQLIGVEKALPAPLPLSLRYVIFGGEALELQALKPWFERHGDRHPQLVNMYGITETTVHVTYRPITLEDLNHSSSVIGRPIPDLQLYLLDPHQQRVPIGVPGELYVGGAGLARGYLNRSELTRERFIANPFIQEAAPVPASDRLYRTGDLARYLPNGDIEYLGRMDFQVKIRGFRIELGEIEAMLAQHPSIQENVVLVREDTPGDQRLVAYIVPKLGQTLKTADLRQALKQKLPDYMVPATFIVLDTLPLTSNGKVDRKGLPKPDAARPDLDDRYVAPSSSTEQRMVDIWAQVLGFERIGIHDNFFELGGHSILATQVLARLRQEFSVELSLRTFFEAPTVANLAGRVEIAHWAARSMQAAHSNGAGNYEEGEL